MAILREKLKHAATVGEADSFSQPRELEQKVPSCRARSSAVAHLPDGAIAIFAEKQAAIFGDRDSDRASPDITEALTRHARRMRYPGGRDHRFRLQRFQTARLARDHTQLFDQGRAFFSIIDNESIVFSEC